MSKNYSLSNILHDLKEIKISYGDLELRIPNFEEIVVLAHNSFQNILKPGEENFLINSWVAESDLEVFKLRMIHHHMIARLEMSPADWNLVFVVFVNETQPVGVINLRGSDFPDTKTVSTGSWIIIDQQGKGYGKIMRQMVLELAFRVLGAEFAQSKADSKNKASNVISEKLNYKLNGVDFRRAYHNRKTDKVVKTQNWLLYKNDFVNLPNVNIIMPERFISYLSLDDDILEVLDASKTTTVLEPVIEG